MQKMKNSFQAFVEHNKFQALVAGEREEELAPVEEEELSQGEGSYEEELAFGEEGVDPMDLDLKHYSDEDLEVVLRRGDLNLLRNALDYMGKDSFEDRFREFDNGSDLLMSILFEHGQDSNEMMQIIMPDLLERYSGEDGVFNMLSERDYSISADFVKLVLRLNPDDEVFTRDPSEIPMSLFISASIADKDDVVDVLLSKSQAFLNAFNSKQAEEIFIEYFLKTVNFQYESSDYWTEIGFLLDRNPALAELQEVQQAFVKFVSHGEHENITFLLTRSPILAALYETEAVQQNFMEQLERNPSYRIMKFLLDQDPALAENIEMQKAFTYVAVNIGCGDYNKLKLLLNIHPDFAGQFTEEIAHNGDLREYDVRRYEEVKFLLNRYPALVGDLARGIQEVIHSVMHDGGYGSGYEKIESLLKNYSRFSMFLDEALCDSISRVFVGIDRKLANQRMDTLLEICPSAGKFFTDLLGHRLGDYLGTKENLEYEKIEFLLKCAPDLREKYNYTLNLRFSSDIESENPNYEEIEFLMTRFSSAAFKRYNSESFQQLFSKALRDYQTEVIESLLKIAPHIVTYELDYANGKSIIEKATKNHFSEHISAHVFKAACKVMYDMMRKGDITYPTRKLQDLIQGALIDDALSSAGGGDFSNVDLMLSYFKSTDGGYRFQEIRDKLLKGSVIRGDIGTMEHVIGVMSGGALQNAISMMCDTALTRGCGEFLEYLVGRFPEVVGPQLVSKKENVLDSIITKPATPEGVKIVEHLLFVDELRQAMKPGGLKEYVDQLKLLCTTSKASCFSPLPDGVRHKIGEFLLDRQYHHYAKVKLRVQPSVPEDTLHIKVAAEYMAKVIMSIVNECLTHPLVGEQLQFRTSQCTKWLQDKLTQCIGTLGMIPKHLQKQLVHDVWQAMTDQPPHHQRTKFVVENAIDKVLGPHLLLEFDTPALGLVGDHHEVYEAKYDGV